MGESSETSVCVSFWVLGIVTFAVDSRTMKVEDIEKTWVPCIKKFANENNLIISKDHPHLKTEKNVAQLRCRMGLTAQKRSHWIDKPKRELKGIGMRDPWYSNQRTTDHEQVLNNFLEKYGPEKSEKQKKEPEKTAP
ncbi:MAG: hypothetical protein Q9162_002374 [Coniocarpon cinnabarinum]